MSAFVDMTVKTTFVNRTHAHSLQTGTAELAAAQGAVDHNVDFLTDLVGQAKTNPRERSSATQRAAITPLRVVFPLPELDKKNGDEAGQPGASDQKLVPQNEVSPRRAHRLRLPERSGLCVEPRHPHHFPQHQSTGT